MTLKKRRGPKPKSAPNPENVRVGERLLWSRLAIDKAASQKEYAERADLTRNVYSAYESGSRAITMESAMKLCNRYGLSLDWIMYARLGTIDDPDLKKAIADVRLAHRPND